MTLMRHYWGLALIIIILLSVISATPASANFPSHVEASALSGAGFDFPSQLQMFASLGALSQAVMTNITQSQFTNASANLKNYSKLAEDFNALGITQENETGVVNAIQSSNADLSTLVAKARTYDELSRGVQPLITNDPQGNQTQSDVLKMRALAADIRDLNADLKLQYDVISTFVTQNGLDATQYARAVNSSKAYVAQVGNVLDNATASVFQDTIITLAVPAKTSYGEALHVNGTVKANGAGLSHVAVAVVVDGNTQIMQTSTNASGYYEGVYTTRELALGTHRIIAQFRPVNTPYNPSNSSARSVNVGSSPVSNMLSISKGSLMKDFVTLSGTLRTQTGTPVSDAPVLLYVGDTTYKTATTNENGSYSVSYTESLPQYLASFFVQHDVQAYTRFEPAGLPLDGAQSNALTITSWEFGPYVSASVVLLCAFSALFVYSRRQRQVSVVAIAPEVARPVTEEPFSKEDDDLLVVDRPSQRVTASEEISDGIARAKEMAQDGQGIAAIRAVYGATVRALSNAYRISLSNDMTSREIYFAAADEAPELHVPLKTLTGLYELATYSDKAISTQHASLAIEAAAAIKGQIEARGEIS